MQKDIDLYSNVRRNGQSFTMAFKVRSQTNIDIYIISISMRCKTAVQMIHDYVLITFFYITNL